MHLTLTETEKQSLALSIETLARTELNVLYNTFITKHSDELLEFSVSQYKSDGKGVIKLDFENDYDTSYLTQKQFEKEFSAFASHHKQMDDIIKKYEPDSQFIVMIQDKKGTSFLIHSKRHLMEK